jgi:hypothetical protein
MNGEFEPQHIEAETLHLEGREALAKYEDGNYVFHGSRDGSIDKLSPRQAMTRAQGEMVPDGDPAVAATPQVEAAIFRALTDKDTMRERGISHRTQFGTDNGELFLGADSDVVDVMSESSNVGYVYVFPESKFFSFENRTEEVRAYVDIKPIAVVEISGRELPSSVRPFDESLA